MSVLQHIFWWAMSYLHFSRMDVLGVHSKVTVVVSSKTYLVDVSVWVRTYRLRSGARRSPKLKLPPFFITILSNAMLMGRPCRWFDAGATDSCGRNR